MKCVFVLVDVRVRKDDDLWNVMIFQSYVNECELRDTFCKIWKKLE